MEQKQQPNVWFLNLVSLRYGGWSYSEDYSALSIHWEGRRFFRESWFLGSDYRYWSSKGFHKAIEALYYLTQLEAGDRIVGVVEYGTPVHIGKVTKVINGHDFLEIRIDWDDVGPRIKSLPRDSQIPFEIAKATKELLLEFKVKSIDLPPEAFQSIDYGSPVGSPGGIEEELRTFGRANFNQNQLKGIREEIDAILDNEKEEVSYEEVKLFYGTNRKKTGKEPFEEFFANEEGDELHTGICKVSIPEKHSQGKLERPLALWKLRFRENDEKHVTVKDISVVDSEQFYMDLADDMGQLDNKAALIFIHGYNNSFEDAARRAGQIAFDIPFDGLAGFYSWPSKNQTLAYERDEDLVELAVTPFKKFVINFVEKTGVEKLHFIAHSMGNRLLCTSMNEISKDGDFGDKLEVLQQVVLAAPDIDQKIFRERILPQFQKVGIRRTLYPSPYDQALNFSEVIRSGNPRLGDSGDSIFIEKELDTVDTDSVKTGGQNHSNVFDTKELLTDLYYLLNEGLDPDRRRLVKQEKETKPYWSLPR